MRFSDSFDAPTKDLITSACKLGFEGLIGKRGDAPYQSRRSRDWIKVKCGKRQEFLICGFTEPKGSRNGLGALLLGIHDAKGKLQYAGNVGSGFNDKTLADLRAQLDRLKTETRPSHIAFTVESVSGGEVDALTFLNIPLTLQGVPNDSFGACALSLNLITRVNLITDPEAGHPFDFSKDLSRYSVGLQFDISHGH